MQLAFGRKCFFYYKHKFRKIVDRTKLWSIIIEDDVAVVCLTNSILTDPCKISCLSVSMSLRIFYLSLGIFSVADIRPEISIGQVPYVEAGDDLAVLVVLDGDGPGVSRLDVSHCVRDILILPGNRRNWDCRHLVKVDILFKTGTNCKLG